MITGIPKNYTSWKGVFLDELYQSLDFPSREVLNKKYPISDRIAVIFNLRFAAHNKLIIEHVMHKAHKYKGIIY